MKVDWNCEYNDSVCNHTTCAHEGVHIASIRNNLQELLLYCNSAKAHFWHIVHGVVMLLFWL